MAAGRCRPEPDCDSRRSSQLGCLAAPDPPLCDVMEPAAERLAQKEIGSSDSVRSTTESYEPVEFSAQSSAWQSVSHVFPSTR